ncbi:hypothetical protein CLIB1423_07S05578 [[Candida] railenensis]|uniref:Uncharacterized protein n=1 Tax=[Candida] railenensis TaxID=45579 RepID=A0A9P0VYA6_9ASCO|nr:hypothetical protein CLIB1423_07S05578 [[Candida] railenensis]
MDRRPNVSSFGNMSIFQKRRSHQLGDNQSSVTPPMTPSRSSSVPKTPINSTTTTSDKGKKLLIDQFYNSINEAQNISSANIANNTNTGSNSSNTINNSNNNSSSTSPNVKNNISSNNSNVDLNSTNTSGNGIMINSSNNNSNNNLRNLFSAFARNQQSVGEKGNVALTEETFRQILRQGGARYITIDSNLLNDDDLATYLLNFDSVVTGEALEPITPPVDQHKNVSMDRDQLKPIERIVSDLTNTMDKNIRKSLSTPSSSSSANISNIQIARLKNYVLQLQKETTTLADELVANKDATTKKYHNEVNSNVSKLKDLLQTLEQLESRLNASKTKISSNKAKMNLDIEEKLQTLEYIDKRIIEYTREAKERKMKMFSVISSVAVVLISIWWSIRVYG